MVTLDYHKGGRPCQHSKREILNTIFYVVRTGCQWRYLPHDFPHWMSVYTQFRRWKKQGLIEKMQCKYEQVTKMWADMGYQSKDLQSKINDQHGIDLE